MHQPSDENNKKDPNKKFYFQIDVNSLNSFGSFTEWLKNIIGDSYNIMNVPEFPVVSLPMTDLNPIYGGIFSTSIPLYLGNNQYNEPIYKTKHFVIDTMKNAYVNHLRSHAGHFVSQPLYYKGMFDILN